MLTSVQDFHSRTGAISLHLSLLTLALTWSAPLLAKPDSQEIRILIDQPPLQLNPRQSVDAMGQRINSLLYRGLTQIDAQLTPNPDLAQNWISSADGLSWTFEISPHAQDTNGAPLTAQTIRECLENYRAGKPTALAIKSSFSSWVSTQITAPNRVTLKLDRPDPFLPRNASALRFFRVKGQAVACTEPKSGELLTGTGKYQLTSAKRDQEKELRLEPTGAEQFPVVFEIVRDESSRALKLLKGEADAVQNQLSVSKIRWIQQAHSERFSIIERDGVNVSYLAFNVKDPTLKNQKVREAISRAIPRDQIIEHKMFGFGSPAASFLSPHLTESSHSTLHGRMPYSPQISETLLDEAGYPRSRDKQTGIRFELKYRTTPVREGLETARIIQDALRKIGIEVILEVVEPATFLSSIRKGGFQLYSSRWIGVADGSILYRTLQSSQPNNRVGYTNPVADLILERAMSELNPQIRNRLLAQAQEIMISDLPYFPLWFWSNALVVRKDWAPLITPEKLSLSGAFGPLLDVLQAAKLQVSSSVSSRK